LTATVLTGVLLSAGSEQTGLFDGACGRAEILSSRPRPKGEAIVAQRFGKAARPNGREAVSQRAGDHVSHRTTHRRRIMTVPTLPPRERLLSAASELFCQLGFHAVGVDAITERAGTAKTTLYKLFGSKEALVEAVLDREGRAWRDWFLTGLDEGEGTARERLDRIAPRLREWFAREDFYGCPFLNAVGEHDKSDDRIRRLALAHKAAIHERVVALLREAGASDPPELAHQLGLVVDGAIVTALVTRDPGVGAVAERTIASVLDAGLGHVERRPARRQRTAAA
jgi:AcrR family transcriptional regulator